ncbi:MAG TPA: S1C family serine protease, partial [Pyrinomonadaceae bacterium]|nr:S1C family serine protease [Pyrinomonadaceae bacterium]
MSITVIKRMATAAALALLCALAIDVKAQTTPPAPPKKTSPQVRVNQRRSAPQVVTIVHRLNGLKMFRMLLRSERAQAVASLDSAFKLMDDVHTNVIAGLALDDGETIAAWLPEAEAEFGPPAIPTAAPDVKQAASSAVTETSYPEFKQQYFYDVPDVTVIGPGGKQLLAKYVGFDAMTGLCILKLTRKNLSLTAAMKDEPVDVGENVVLFGPEPVTRAQALLGNNLFVRIGALEGRIENVLPAPSGEIARLKVSAPRLSQANIGGVAVNAAGETIGIVDGLEGNEATILPAASIRRAAQRVLEQQASVPRPWLGVKGEAVAALKLQQILNHGWATDRAAALAGQHRGILLTSVIPDSPAARAALRAGDVILKIDGNEIQSTNDFTWWLEQAGPSSSVRFTVARPDRPTEEALNVKLSGLFEPAISFNFRNSFRTSGAWSLLDHGIETIALRPLVATQLGTTAGLLV